MKIDKRTIVYKKWKVKRTNQLHTQINQLEKEELIDYVIDICEMNRNQIKKMMDDDLIDIIIEYEESMGYVDFY